ncbi:MAG: flagellin [Myxococcota bacterium]
MAMTVVTNVPSMTAQRNLNKTNNSLNKSLQRLSSGLRINTAADDAAGLGISEKLQSQIRSMAQAERNAGDAVSLLQTAESSLSEMSGIVTRMRELTIQAANDTVGSTERQFLDDELTQLRDEFDRIASVTEFNGTKLIDGSVSGTNQLTFQVGTGATSNDRIEVSIGTTTAGSVGTTAATSGLNAVGLTTLTAAQGSLAILDEAISDISTQRATLGASQNRMEVTISNLSSARENLSAANSRIRDVDVASESANLTRANILTQAGVSVLAQANQTPTLALSLI